MGERLKAKVVVKPGEGGRSEILVHDPQTGRDIQTGMKVPAAQVDREVRGLKEQLERAGNDVSVREV